MPKNPTGTVYP